MTDQDKAHAHPDGREKEFQQDMQIRELNTNICNLTGSVNKLTDRIDKRIEESDKWRAEVQERHTQTSERVAINETITHRLEKMFWLLGTAIATAGVASAVSIILQFQS